MARYKLLVFSAAGVLSAIIGPQVLAGSAPPKTKPLSLEKPAPVSYQMRLSATSGNAPLSVTFTVSGSVVLFGGVWLETGDGKMIAVCPPGRRCGEVTIKHTYASAGNYRARLIGQSEGARENFNEVQVKVSGG